MTRILGAYVDALFSRLDLLRLQAEVQDDNPASAAVLLRHGFVAEGVRRCSSAVARMTCVFSRR